MTIAFAGMSAIATVCNATIHKYLFVFGSIGKNKFKLSKTKVYFFMFFLQSLWPLVGALTVTIIDLRPLKAMEESKMVSNQNAYLYGVA